MESNCREVLKCWHANVMMSNLMDEAAGIQPFVLLHSFSIPLAIFNLVEN
jgi:hypothetical protein